MYCATFLVFHSNMVMVNDIQFTLAHFYLKCNIFTCNLADKFPCKYMCPNAALKCGRGCDNSGLHIVKLFVVSLLKIINGYLQAYNDSK